MAGKLVGRTVREFETSEDVVGVLDSWAKQAGYGLVEHDETSRTYKRGKGFWVASQKLKISWNGNECTLEAWVSPPFFGKGISIESGGVTAVIPRDRARQQVSALLQMFGQPPIL